MSAARKRFLALDGLRGIAALMVAVHHIFGWAGWYLMVELFLVLSGFVLSHSYLYREKRVGVLDFVWRRFARLWPLHIFSLLFMYGVLQYLVLGNPFFHGKYNTGWTFLQHLTLTHNIGFPPTGEWVITFNFPSWSISVEFWVNVLFILLVFRGTPSWLLGIASAASLWVLGREQGDLQTYNQNLMTYLNSGLLRGIASFALGIVAYRAYRATAERDWNASLLTLFEGLALVAVGLLVAAKVHGYPAFELAAPPIFMGVVFVFALERGLLSRGLKCLEHLGTISYSVYLMHIPMLVLFALPAMNWIPESGQKIATLIGTLIAAQITYSLVEIPAQRWLQRRNPFRPKASA